MKRTVQFKSLLLGGASLMAVGIVMVPAVAQDQMETVTVTGLRASLQSAQAIKQNSDQVVDSITSVDIGALPDRNIAEALQRVPGVTLQRNSTPNDVSRMGSTGNSVFVRGLSWVKTLVNGRDEFTAVNGRSLSFADVSADLMAGVDVYKSPTAAMIEGGVGGIVDLRTRRPFDAEGQLIAVSGDYTYGDLADRALPSVNALYSNRFNTAIGEVGVLASVDWQDQITRTEGVNLYPYSCLNKAAATFSNSADGNYAACTAQSLGTGRVMAPQGWAWRQLEFKQQRLAANAVLQWRPTDKLEFTLNAINTYAVQTDMEHYVQMSINQTQALAGTYNAQSTWIGGPASLTTIDTRGGTGHNRNSDISLNVKFTPTDNLEITADAQFVESSSPYKNMTFFTGQGSSPVVTLDASGDDPKITSTPTSTKLGDYYMLAAMDHLQYNVGHTGNGRLDATYKFGGSGAFGWIKAFDTGFRTEQKMAVSRSTGYNWGATCPTGWGGNYSACPYMDGSAVGGYANMAGGTAAATTSAPIAKYAEVFNYNKMFGNNLPSLVVPTASLAGMNSIDSWKLFSAIEPLQAQTDNGVQSWASWNSYAAIAGCKGDDVTCIAAYKNLYGNASGGNRMSTQKEETYAGYAQLEFGHDSIFGYDIPIDGNIGLRLVRTEDSVSSGKLVMPILNQNSCVLGTTYTSTDTPPVVTKVTDCSGFSAAVQFLGGGDITKAVAGEGATVDRPAVKSGYTDLLPSFNLRAKLSDTVQARMAYSETIVRPDFDKTNSSAQLSFSFYDASTYRSGVFKNAPSGNGGNPYLKPMHATNYDLSVEWYFSPSGSLTMSAFHKDLSNYIMSTTAQMVFTHPISGQSMTFNYLTYVNGDKGKVEGVELAYQEFYDQLPGFWGGFGLQANYTKIYNSGGHNSPGNVGNAIAIANSNSQDLPLEGMSNDSYNVALLYAKYDIDARLAYNWRSHYLSSTSDANSPYEPDWLENYGQLDGSVFYGFLEHYKVGVQVTNITGAVFYTDMGYKNYHPRTNWIENDRKFAFVVRANW